VDPLGLHPHYPIKKKIICVQTLASSVKLNFNKSRKFVVAHFIPVKIITLLAIVPE
jgi:hypothetical protein